MIKKLIIALVLIPILFIGISSLFGPKQIEWVIILALVSIPIVGCVLFIRWSERSEKNHKE